MFTAPKPRRIAPHAEEISAIADRARRSATRPVSITTPESMALIPLGAWEWASGSHVCIGTRAIFTPKPTKKSAPEARSSGREAVPAATIVRSWARFRVPVWEKTSPMPMSTSIEPTEFCTRYFMPASRLAARSE